MVREIREAELSVVVDFIFTRNSVPQTASAYTSGLREDIESEIREAIQRVMQSFFAV